MQHLGLISLVVNNYDEAIEFYTKKLFFTLIEDTQLSATKRWVTIAPPNSPIDGCKILLAQANNKNQLNAVGNQTGGRVFLFLYTNRFEEDYKNMLLNGIEFIEKPRQEKYGKVVVFKDLYGNLWDFIEIKN
ncbi:MAG: VOC family protein [Sediminibacterium sp.]|nr:VOC family protein [Sediminibacterium sp.]